MDAAKPQQVRHHQSHETDRAAQQDRGDRRDRGAAEGDRLKPRHRDAERARLVFAENQHVERRGENAKTAPAAIEAPASAARFIPAAAAPSSIAASAPAAAPPETPRMYGSASGFLKST